MLKTEHQDDAQKNPLGPQSNEQFVVLPGHPFYGRRVRVVGSRSSTTYTLAVIEDPTRPGFHYHIPQRWLASAPPLPALPSASALRAICLSWAALDKMVQLILTQDETRRTHEDLQPVERDDSQPLEPTADIPPDPAQRPALLPGPEADGRDSP